MSEISKYTCRLCIISGENVYKLGVVGFLKDGGFYLSDLGKKTNNYIAYKALVGTKNGIMKESINYKINLKKPKISHHIDGNAHISGEGIKSGFNKDGSPKGIGLKSFDLRSSNDGGPVFIIDINSKNINDFESIKINDFFNLNKKHIKKCHLIQPDNGMYGYNKNKKTFSYIIEGFYIDKSELPKECFTSEYPFCIKKYFDFFGVVELLTISTPKECPYILGIFFRIEYSNNNQDGFYIGGAPGYFKPDGSWEVLYIHNVGNDNLEKLESLNYVV